MISQILKKLNITHKKIKNHSIIKDISIIEADRKTYANKINSDAFMNFVSIDETAFYRNDFKRYGYSMSGKRIQKIYKCGIRRDILLLWLYQQKE